MKISKILINHMHEPIGFDLSYLRIEFQVQADQFASIEKKLIIKQAGQEVYTTDFVPYEHNFFEPDLNLQARSRYQVIISIKNNDEIETAETFFETGKMSEPFSAKWIGHSDKNLQNTILKKELRIDKEITQARLYITGLGLYEAYLDGEKIGDEYLTPGSTDYTKWTQVQTYDVTRHLQEKTHELMVSLADGWYKGNMGFDGGKTEIYGNQQRLIAELHIDYIDGKHEVLITDETWLATAGQITKSSIYYGEDLDANLELTNWQAASVLDYPLDVLCDRLSMPLLIDEYLPVKDCIHTPAGELVLDFGQNQAGWVEFYNRSPKGTTVTFEMGEILQEGNFYRENLRHARAAFSYTSDGVEGWVRPHFTYYGYRYVRLTGLAQDYQADDFRAAVLFSQMPETGSIKTDNSKVNRLFQNVIWGQKSNFFDIPTDCPQRDERLGWTGDADVFSNTAAFNANVFPFFKKYARDMAVEQEKHGGMLTMYAPAFGVDDGGAAVWGDAATIIPWNMYQVYGDAAIIKQNYQAMKNWVDWISRQTKTEHLWTGCFQFGDWIALDGENPALPTGKTDEDFIASVYYYYSSWIVAQSAELLGKKDDYNHYSIQADKIRAAIRKEYITETGRLAIDTQTAYALALYFELLPEEQTQRVLADLVTRLGKDKDHLKTGFVGTPFICQVLSKYGAHKLATKIFMQEDFPSWLYAVNMGATTVWERWNSVMEDGSMNPEGMNSLNHYSIGAIMEWAYKYLLGLGEHTPGYQEVELAPQFDYHLKKVSGQFESSYGLLKVSYQIESDPIHTIQLSVDVPFGQTVRLNLPRVGKKISVNGETLAAAQLNLTCGHYQISYTPTADYIERYSAETPAIEIMADSELVTQIDAVSDVLSFFKGNPDALHGGLGTMSLTKLNTILPFINIEPEALDKINHILVKTPILSEREALT